MKLKYKKEKFKGKARTTRKRQKKRKKRKIQSFFENVIFEVLNQFCMFIVADIVSDYSIIQTHFD